MRLAKYLAKCGVASRRASEEIIRSGRVTVDGELVDDPARAVEDGAAVLVEDRPITPEDTEVWALNKPVGVVSTAEDPQGRSTVVELVPSSARLYPVGRLDADSTGLILVSNDGALANHLTHPRYEVSKAYAVRLRDEATQAQIDALRYGPHLDDGPTRPVQVNPRGPNDLEIVIGEGRNRQVRRMIEAVGNEVVGLRRVRIGSLLLGDLAEGASRRLGKDEVAKLWKDDGR